MSPATKADRVERVDLTLDDFITGLLAGLASEGVQVISLRGAAFYAAVRDVFEELDREQDEHNINLRFWITLNRIHGDSADVREGITKAVQRDLISLDNPVYLDMRLKVQAEDAEAYLDSLPGGAQLFHQLAQKFLQKYSEHA